MGYGFKRMQADVRQDLSTYIARSVTQNKKSVSTLSVLLHSPSFYVIANYRILFWLKNRIERSANRIVKLSLSVLFNILRSVSFQAWKVLMKISISNWPEIGGGFYLSNKGGIIIGPKKIGKSCIIHHNVTIGMNLEQQHPEIGDNVSIGANSIVYCRIVNDNVTIESETVVAKNIPKNKVIKGNPARMVSSNSDISNCATAHFD